MKTIFALLAGAMAVIAASPALAQDDYDDTLPDTPADVFSGPHVEASVGWDHLSTQSYKNIDSTAYVESAKNGLTYGGAIGYDLPLTEHLTLGGEFGLYTSSSKWNNTENLVSGTFNTATVRAGRDLYFGARLGYALNFKTQVYGKFGYTNTHFGVTGTDGSSALYDGINSNGVRVGVGAEHKLAKAIYVKLEYDYSRYGSGQFNYSDTTPDASAFDLRSTRSQVLTSVGFRF